ncbi:MAG: ferritin-like domain-containing protein [Pseudonocardiaceae bacterium]
MLAAGAILFLAGPTVLAGCTIPARAPQGPDPLAAPARHAEADVALATGVAQLAAQADPGLAAAARTLARDRLAHAAALRAELRRARPTPAPHGGSSPIAPPPIALPPIALPPTALPPTANPQIANPAANPDLAGARSALTQATHAAQDEATALVMTLPGYRAALLASIAACCASHLPRPDMETYRGDRTPAGPDMSPYRGGNRGTVDSLQRALGAEHAAIWVYGVVGAFAPRAWGGQLVAAATAHRARRNATERMLIDAGARPVPPEPGYLTPEPVADAASALRLAITAETDAAAAWRSVIERSTADSDPRSAADPNLRSAADPDLRNVALDALTAAAVQATRWRETVGSTPLTVPFPGAPFS